jgi:hypothetical protein
MNVDPADLMTDPADRPPVPTFDEYTSQVERMAGCGNHRRSSTTTLLPLPPDSPLYCPRTQHYAASSWTTSGASSAGLVRLPIDRGEDVRGLPTP